MRRTTESKKDAQIAAFREGRRQILEAVSAMSSQAQDQVFLGAWSLKDLLAHLVGWDYTNLEAVKAIQEGKLPAFYSYHDSDWKSYNARLVKQYKRENLGELLDSVETSQQRLIDLLETIPAEAYTRDYGVRVRRYRVTIARILQAEIDDEKKHFQQILDFIGSGENRTGEQGSGIRDLGVK